MDVNTTDGNMPSFVVFVLFRFSQSWTLWYGCGRNHVLFFMSNMAFPRKTTISYLCAWFLIAIPTRVRGRIITFMVHIRTLKLLKIVKQMLKSKKGVTLESTATLSRLPLKSPVDRSIEPVFYFWVLQFLSLNSNCWFPQFMSPNITLFFVWKCQIRVSYFSIS